MNWIALFLFATLYLGLLSSLSLLVVDAKRVHPSLYHLIRDKSVAVTVLSCCLAEILRKLSTLSILRNGIVIPYVRYLKLRLDLAS